MGRILTPAIHLDLPKPKIKIPGVQFERNGSRIQPISLAEILQFVQT
jgi:hypothetical protein